MVPDSVLTEFVTGTDFVKAVLQRNRRPPFPAVGTSPRPLPWRPTTTTKTERTRSSTSRMMRMATLPRSPTAPIRETATPIWWKSGWCRPSMVPYGSMFPDKPTHILSTFIRPGAPNYTLASDIEYNSLQAGDTEEGVFQPAQQVITDFEYHLHGGIKTTTISAAGLPIRSPAPTLIPREIHHAPAQYGQRHHLQSHL